MHHRVMPNYRRDQTPGGTWFFTVVAFQRRPIFCDEQFRKSLRHSIQKTRQKHPFVIHAWVLLPDHLHCIWSLPEDDANFSIRWKLIKQCVSRSCPSLNLIPDRHDAVKNKRRESTIWQRRFWEHRIHTEKDFRHHMDYIHFNSVKHGLSQSPAEWPYSTIHRLIAKGVYTQDWATEPNDQSNGNHDYGE